MMGLEVNITSVTGQSPYYVFICDESGENCIYIDETEVIPFLFQIPSPYDTLTEYKLKIIDGNGSIITANNTVEL